MNSYDINGNKQSFANWVSMLRTYETPFINLVKTDKVNHALFNWQVDKLANVDEDNSAVEGSDAISNVRQPTKVLNNVTQILSKVVKVSDTASKVESWGRNKETAYQMEKASKELFKDLEWAFLNNTAMEPGNHGKARITAGVRGLASMPDVADPATGAITHKITDTDFTEDDLFDLTYNLYLAGSKANLICFHPSMATFFSDLVESDTRARIFKNNPNLMLEVFTIVDPIGQKYSLLPLRQMPLDVIYILNTDDFTQKVLRPPRRVMLDRDGSYDKWLFDIEIGLRLSNPHAVGVLQRAYRDQFLLRKQRGLNTAFANDTQIGVDFVTSGGDWSPSATEHSMHVADGDFFKVSVASSLTSIGPDKILVKVTDVTDSNKPVLVKVDTVTADGTKHDVVVFQGIVADAVNNHNYKIECIGYNHGEFTIQQLGFVKLEKKAAPGP